MVEIIMGYKKNRVQIGKVSNRKEYLEITPYCEICGKTYPVAVHHHLKQGVRILDKEYTFDVMDGYSTLCHSCHAIVHTDKAQYDRRLLGKTFNGRLNWLHYSYWHELKNGKKPEYYIERKEVLFDE
jgi:hypothetical protein